MYQIKLHMEGKNIVIVGGNSGIGKATAEMLQNTGANLA